MRKKAKINRKYQNQQWQKHLVCCRTFLHSNISWLRNKVIAKLLKLPSKITCFRSSHERCSVGKGLLRNFTNFTGKHLCYSPFFNKVAGLRPATLLKRSLWHRCFPVNFVKFLRTPFYIEHLRRLLL